LDSNGNGATRETPKILALDYESAGVNMQYGSKSLPEDAKTMIALNHVSTKLGSAQVLRYAHLAPEHLASAAKRIERVWEVVEACPTNSPRQA
jgi:hypothetical protein